MAKCFGISPAALFRHKSHAQRQQHIGDGGIPEQHRPEFHRLWEKYKQENDTLLKSMALREVRAFLESIKQGDNETG